MYSDIKHLQKSKLFQIDSVDSSCQGTVNEAVVPGQNISPGNSGVFDVKATEVCFTLILISLIS